jgi:hypothetical protein
MSRQSSQKGRLGGRKARPVAAEISKPKLPDPDSSSFHQFSKVASSAGSKKLNQIKANKGIYIKEFNSRIRPRQSEFQDPGIKSKISVISSIDF